MTDTTTLAERLLAAIEVKERRAREFDAYGSMEHYNLDIVIDDPRAVLRRCAADRKIVDQYASAVKRRDAATQLGHTFGHTADLNRQIDVARTEVWILQPVLSALAEAYDLTDAQED